MDDIVKQAMAKWPNVPHCHGWLGLDARGQWRMRDERTQALGLPGDRIMHGALLGFINRNYMHDEHGCWYFQNGPQRVYVDLEATPYIARTDPTQGFLLHTGEPLPPLDAAWLTERGQLILEGGGRIAAVDDRDVAQCLSSLHSGTEPAGDDQLLAWLNDASNAAPMTLRFMGSTMPLQRIDSGKVAAHFGFERRPRPVPG
jgi:hypothetical protein